MKYSLSSISNILLSVLASVDLIGIVLSLVPLSFSGNENQRPRGKVTKLVSGDDLDDDFSFVDKKPGGAKDEPVDIVGSASHSQESPVKSKKKQGPKVVNFVG